MGIAIFLQINHTIDKQTGGNRESSSPGSGSGFTWGSSPKLVGGKAFNSGNSNVSVGGGNVNGTNGTGESAEEKNMFIGLLDIFGFVDDTTRHRTMSDNIEDYALLIFLSCFVVSF